VQQPEPGGVPVDPKFAELTRQSGGAVFEDVQQQRVQKLV
jgi:hypothetical protein